MKNAFYTDSPAYNSATVERNRLTKIGGNNYQSTIVVKVCGISRAHHLQHVAGMREQAEQQMMNIAFKANRTQEKRDRRAQWAK